MGPGRWWCVLVGLPYRPVSIPHREPRRALRVSSPSLRFASGGLDAVSCASTSRTALCVRRPFGGASCAVVCFHTRGLMGSFPVPLCRTIVRLAVPLPPLHGVTLVGGPVAALYGRSPGRPGHSRMFTAPTPHVLGIFLPLEPQSSFSGTPITSTLHLSPLHCYAFSLSTHYAPTSRSLFLLPCPPLCFSLHSMSPGFSFLPSSLSFCSPFSPTFCSPP